MNFFYIFTFYISKPGQLQFQFQSLMLNLAEKDEEASGKVR